MRQRRYGRVQQYYDLTKLYERFFATDRATADNALTARMQVFKKMNAVEREQALKASTTVTHTNVKTDLARVVQGRW